MNDPHSPAETGRDSRGRFAIGASGNPGGRPRLPEWFRVGSEDALRYLLDVATGAVEVEKQELRIRAAEWVAGRVFGRPVAAAEEEAPWEITPAVASLLAVAYADGVRSTSDLLVKMARDADAERERVGRGGEG
ncbi:MAG: hypothetical protein IT382_19665 [Deltaproteobacteria bacterium]|nr:hypothetical protein [Deltaproteobacteria bacterium]